jgi:putative ABC transport system substrate-binding protein
MRRTAALAALAVAIAASPIAAQTVRSAKIYRVAMLESIPAAATGPNIEAFRRGLRELGYVEGRNLVIEYRSSDGDASRFPGLAAEVVALKVDVIVARGTPAAAAAKAATPPVPVVMAAMGEGQGLVDSFARPGSNVTGVTTFSTELAAKRLELLAEIAPAVRRVGLLHNMGNPAAPAEWEETQAAARTRGMAVELIDVRDAADIPRAFDAAVRKGVDAVIIGADGVAQSSRQVLIALAGRNRLPAIYPAREFVEAGGLMAYAVNYPDLYFGLAKYVDKIMKGTAPADLPVERPTKFELVLNLRTSAALGLVIPNSLLMRADEIIR